MAALLLVISAGCGKSGEERLSSTTPARGDEPKPAGFASPPPKTDPDDGRPEDLKAKTAPSEPEPEVVVEKVPRPEEILEAHRSRSLGSPIDGRVEDAAILPMRGPGFQFNPRRDPKARYGTAAMVAAIMRAAEIVHREMPGGELTVSDLGFEHGGPIPGHGSHQSGRDVDVLFYLLDESGKPMPSVGAPIDPDGRGTDYRDLLDPKDDVPLRIDLPRTWRFTQALLEDPVLTVQRIFVVEHLRTMLLQHALSIRAPKKLVEQFEAVTCQPPHPHDDHLHFRFFCTPEDVRNGCEDMFPVYPWQRSSLRAEGLEPIMAKPRVGRPKAPTTSPEDARMQAGAMHESVKAFLDRREEWRKKPSPGRPYCR